MNTELMIDEVLSIVDDPSFDREDDVLKHLNQAQVAVAASLLLPGLSDGYSTVTTVTDAYKVDVPADYHHTPYGAKVDGRPVTVARNFADIYSRFEGLSLQKGPVASICIHNRNVVYQSVPSVETDIELFYYRVPAKMTDSATSFPDGLSNALQNVYDDYAQILIHFAAARLFSKIEQGLEGNKPDTTYHMGMYNSLLETFDIGPHSKERTHPPTPVCEVNW